MFTRFFLDRPITANVIAVLTVLFGIVAARRLPVEQYPSITPPTVQVVCNYPGASAKVVADTVAAPIEQQVNGVENMLYMSSTSGSDGAYTLTVTFDIGTHIDTAQVLVQNRVASAEPLLPEEIRRQGVVTKKVSTNIVLVVALTSPDKTFDDLFLANYATLNLRDELSRIKGVGDVQIFGGSPYAMRVWLDPEKLKARNLSTQDVVAALQEQNVQVAAGTIGQPPAAAGQQFQYTVTALGRLSDPKQFESIIVKAGAEGRITRLNDVAAVTLGGQIYDQFARVKGRPDASVVIFQLPGANSVNVAAAVKEAMKGISPAFPPGLVYDIPFDTTLFVDQAIWEVYKTLLEAGGLVLFVILVFLQDWRAVLVPATTVPVTIIGTFAFMPALGFSVNLLTLFGLVLAIGIVVDDAIVIVENAARHVEQGMSPRDGAIRAMSEVTGPVLGITLVLMAVFLPSAFLGGITGQLYRQFALTIAVTAFISAINALTLKPVQCATYLRAHTGRKNILSRGFNYVYGLCEAGYGRIVWVLVRATPVVLVVFVALVALTGWWYVSLPKGFLPTEDQGYVITLIQLPDAASLQRTEKVVDRIETILKETKGIYTWFAIGGFSFVDGGNSSSAAAIFIVFDDWKDRADPSLSQNALLGELNTKFGELEEAMVFVFPPPAIQGLGEAGGFQMQVQDRREVGLKVLEEYTRDIIEEAGSVPALGPMNTTFRAEVPQLYADIDRTKVKTLDLRLSDVFGTLQTQLGSAYVNDFNKFGRTYQVRAQADPRFRGKVDDLRRLEVRNQKGKMVPLSTVAHLTETLGPQFVTRYNMYPTAAIRGAAAPGHSSGEALDLMEKIARRKLPDSMGFQWTAISYQEKRVGNEAIGIFAIAVLLVYLVLAALYESWLLPFAVILVVPLGIMGSVAAVAARGAGWDINVYTQIGIVLIIALASKNAILIVEFARELRREGHGILDAAVQASRQRFRPILMTSFAFILGVWPLVHATGAGAASRQALGTAVFGGMITSTVLAVFFTPVFFVTFQWLAELRKKPVVIAAAAPVNGTSTHAVPGNDTTAHGIHAGGSASARG
jgi:hydrophobic/amphiphilic exporter-1 (mainly G- bacteria), HAE1 family